MYTNRLELLKTRKKLEKILLFILLMGCKTFNKAHFVWCAYTKKFEHGHTLTTHFKVWKDAFISHFFMTGFYLLFFFGYN